MSIIRAEIRKWRLKETSIEGDIYKDTSDVYDDGEHVVIMGIKKVREGATFFLVETDYGVYKLDKEERA